MLGTGEEDVEGEDDDHEHDKNGQGGQTATRVLQRRLDPFDDAAETNGRVLSKHCAIAGSRGGCCY